MVRDEGAGWVCSLIVSLLWCIYNAVPPYLMLQVRPAASASKFVDGTPYSIHVVESHELACHVALIHHIHFLEPQSRKINYSWFSKHESVSVQAAGEPVV